MADDKTIEYEVTEAGIGVLSLNRPRRYNSINEEMIVLKLKFSKSAVIDWRV